MHKSGKGCSWTPWLASPVLTSGVFPFVCLLRSKEMHCDDLTQRLGPASARSQTLAADADKGWPKETYTWYTLLHASSTLPGTGIPWWQTVRLFLTIDLRSLLCEVWFHSGKYEMGPGEGSWLGQEGTPYSEASYLCVTLGILPWHSFQPLRCLEQPPWRFNLPPQDWCIPAGHGAWVVPHSPPLSILHNWRKEKAEKCSKGLWPSEHNVSVDVGRCGCDTYLPLTFTAVKAQHFAILWSAQQPGEDASLTRPLDGTDKHWGWTDLAITPQHQSYILTTKATLANVHCTITIIYWASLTHSRWKAYTHFENKYKCTPKHHFTLVDDNIQ